MLALRCDYSMTLLRVFLGALACLVFVGVTGATDHFAAPNGSPTGDGSIDHPWSLDTALGSPSGSQPAAVKPGDTIWLRGGIYIPATDNGYLSHVTGTPGSPIIVRNYNDERATLQAGTNAYVLAVYGSVSLLSKLAENLARQSRKHSIIHPLASCAEGRLAIRKCCC